MSPPRTRTALALSALMHTTVLGALLLSVRPPPSLPSPLLVRFLKVSAGAEAPHSEVSSLTEAALGPARPARGPTAARPPKTAPAKSAGPVPVELLPPSTLMATLGVPGGPALEERPGAAEGGGAQARAEAGGSLAHGAAPSASRLGELHRRLAEAAARCYPAAARRFRLQGQVPLHFCLDAAGTATALNLQGSTGSAVLDRSALECVVPGAQPLSGFEGCFLVPVHFGG